MINFINLKTDYSIPLTSSKCNQHQIFNLLILQIYWFVEVNISTFVEYQKILQNGMMSNWVFEILLNI